MSTQVRAESTSDDVFYLPVPDDFTQRSGELLRAREVQVKALAGAAKAWQVVYSTRTTAHAPIPASALVLTPKGSTATSTLLYCPSFRGLGGHVAPSEVLPESVVDPVLSDVAAVLERGWAVAIPDGQCLGMTGLGPHTFLAGFAGAHTVLDLARALPAIGDLDVSGGFVIWGYADGGRTAIFAAEHHPIYAPEVDLRGVAAGAVPANLRALVAELNGGPWSGLVMASMVGLSRAYARLPVTHVLTEDGRRGFAHAQTLTAEQLIDSYRYIPVGTWCERREPWNDPLWRYVLAAEAAAHLAPQVPVHLYHGTEDALIPIAMSRALFAEYRLLNVDLSWREYATDHARAAIDGATEALARLGAALLRRPTRSSPSAESQTT
jgi:hypothetical protein